MPRIDADLVNRLGFVDDLSESGFAYLMLAPIFLYVGVMAVWPLLRTFEMSLHQDAVGQASQVGAFIGVDRYVGLFTGEYSVFVLRPLWDLSQPLKSAIVVTVVFAVVSVALSTLLGFGQALVLNMEFRGRKWFRTAIILPWTVPIVIQGMVFFMLFQPGIGGLYTVLHDLGLASEAPLADSATSLGIIIVADVWKQSAFMALLILAGLQTIDHELYKVGRIAGASRWQRFRTITLPLVLPAVIVAIVFRTIGAMWIFGLIRTVTSCSTLPSLSCVVVDSFNNGYYGTASTVAFIQAGMVALVLIGFVVYYFRGTTEVAS